MAPLYYGKQELELTVGQTIFDYADSLQVRVPTSCRRSGECHECIVEIQRGMEALSDPSEAEGFLRDNYRLACQARVIDSSASIDFSLLRRQPKILQHSVRRSVPLGPMTTRRDGGIYFHDKRIDDSRANIYGLAIDLGTTTIVFNLVDLEDGRVVHTGSFENPQRFGGSDVINRISYDGGEFKGELHQAVIAGLNYEIRDMCQRIRVPRKQIYEVVLVGNAAMRDIFFGFDVQSIGERPYQSLTQLEMARGERTTTTLNFQAGELGLNIFPKANVYGGPLIGSHVGADIAADLLAIEMDQEEAVVMLLDVGTNTEVVLGNRHRMLAASCPAGPAFEGGEVLYGMPGYEGAVESVELVDGQVRWHTIGEQEPQGICGSGLIDLLAELRRNQWMNQLGVLSDGSKEFFFVPEREMSLSRADISALAQAKAANYSGQWILLRRLGVPVGQLQKLYLAGGFANYIKVANAVAIGFIPDLPLERIEKVGNASLEGATLMLLSRKMRRTVEEMMAKIEHVELETTSDFFEIFVEGCMFQPMEPPPNP